MTKQKRVLFVAGNFSNDPAEVRKSGYIEKMYTSLCDNLTEIQRHHADLNYETTFVNGGSFDELQALVDSVTEYDIVLWFANVPNTYEKIVNTLKMVNPKIILVTSKNNFGDRYTYHEITGRMLSVKANLCVVFNKTEAGVITGTVMDPLMNGFCQDEADIRKMTFALATRMHRLTQYTRAGSYKIADAIQAPDETVFFKIAHDRADQFHELIHANNKDRFLGNLSFRCENGFPSFRAGEGVFVSRRNIDKRMIGAGGFVGVSLDTAEDGTVRYFGENKPSVDTPVQVALYKQYPRVKYMMHAHVYVEGAPMTDERIPCGALEEVASIAACLPADIGNAAINLKGHGSIVFAEDLAYFDQIKYEARPFLEFED